MEIHIGVQSMLSMAQDAQWVKWRGGTKPQRGGFLINYYKFVLIGLLSLIIMAGMLEGRKGQKKGRGRNRKGRGKGCAMAVGGWTPLEIRQHHLPLLAQSNAVQTWS